MALSMKDWTLTGANGQTIFGTTHLPLAGKDVQGSLLICHGFKGYKDYGLFPALAQSAAERGLIAHRFNFSHSGVTQDFSTFANPELFEQDTWGKQIYDLHAVAEACAQGDLPGQADAGIRGSRGDRTVWFGHSRGGVTVLLAGARVFKGLDSTGVPPPSGIIAAAAPHLACSLTPQQAAILKRSGYLSTASSRTGQELRIGKTWLEEIEADPTGFDPVEAVKHLQCPVLIVHGDADQTVPVEAASILAARTPDRVAVKIIADASHTFNAPNPLPMDTPAPPATQQMIDLVCDYAIRSCTAEG